MCCSWATFTATPVKSRLLARLIPLKSPRYTQVCGDGLRTDIVAKRTRVCHDVAVIATLETFVGISVLPIVAEVADRYTV